MEEGTDHIICVDKLLKYTPVEAKQKCHFDILSVNFMYCDCGECYVSHIVLLRDHLSGSRRFLNEWATPANMWMVQSCFPTAEPETVSTLIQGKLAFCAWNSSGLRWSSNSHDALYRQKCQLNLTYGFLVITRRKNYHNFCLLTEASAFNVFNPQTRNTCRMLNWLPLQQWCCGSWRWMKRPRIWVCTRTTKSPGLNFAWPSTFR